MPTVIKFLLALVVILVGCWFYVYKSEFPIERHLACHDGNSFDGRIVGKMGGALLVEIRTDSGADTIELPFASLLLPYRIYAHWLPEAPPSYPVARRITSKDGRSLNARVLERTREGVTIERTSDSKRFHIPFEVTIQVSKIS